MLRDVTLRNIALVEALSIQLQPGLTVITGETGSGKSILMEAITTALGSRVSPRDVLRPGCERGTIELGFDLGRSPHWPHICQTLNDEAGTELDANETELLISREFTPTNSRVRVNGTPVQRQVLDALRPLLVEAHGQHELTTLFEEATQREALDGFSGLGGGDLSALREEMFANYAQWQAAVRAYETLKTDRERFEAERELATFQLNELMEAQLEEDTEDEQLKNEQATLQSVDTLRDGVAKVMALIQGDGWESPGADTLLSQLDSELGKLASTDANVSPLSETVTGLHEQLRDVSAGLEKYAAGLEADPERLAYLIDRRDVLEKLKRKYGGSLATAIQTRNTLADQLHEAASTDDRLQQLQADAAQKEQACQQTADRLSQARKTLARQLTEALLPILSSLAMPYARFDVQVTPRQRFDSTGQDEITFVFSANPGMPLAPLAKVASGGELSRVLLALKSLTASSRGVGTLLFDEVDTGISGAVAKAVGERLVALGEAHQVLAITHQPLVAAMGQHMLHVIKHITPESTEVAIHTLDSEAERKAVLTEMTTGRQVTPVSESIFSHLS